MDRSLWYSNFKKMDYDIPTNPKPLSSTMYFSTVFTSDEHLQPPCRHGFWSLVAIHALLK